MRILQAIVNGMDVTGAGALNHCVDAGTKFLAILGRAPYFDRDQLGIA